MNTGFLFTVLVGSLLASFSHAVPLCREVLKVSSSTVTDKDVIEAITQIARLKVTLDQAQTDGGVALGSLSLAKQFPQKYQELIQQLHGRLSEAKINQLIKEEIQKLQNLETSRELEKDRQVHIQKDLVTKKQPSFLYDRTSKKPGYAFSGGSNLAEKIFLPNEDRLLYFDRNDLIKIPTKGKGHMESVVESARAGALLNDGKTMLLVQQGYAVKGVKLLTYNIQTRKSTRPRAVKFTARKEAPHDIQNLLINPSNNLALLIGYKSDEGYLHSVVDVTTGKEVLNQNKFPKDTTGAVFLNDSQIAVVGENKMLQIIDIPTQKKVQSELINNIVYDESEYHRTPRLLVSNDGTILVIAHQGGFISLEAKDISRKIHEIRQDDAFEYVVKTRDYPHAMLILDGTSKAKLMDMEYLVVEFEFPSKIVDMNPHDIGISPDGQDVLVINRHHRSGEDSVHWHRKDEN